MDVQNLDPVGLESKGQGNVRQTQSQLQGDFPGSSPRVDVIRKGFLMSGPLVREVVSAPTREICKVPSWHDGRQKGLASDRT